MTICMYLHGWNQTKLDNDHYNIYGSIDSNPDCLDTIAMDTTSSTVEVKWMGQSTKVGQLQ